MTMRKRTCARSLCFGRHLRPSFANAERRYAWSRRRASRTRAAGWWISSSWTRWARPFCWRTAGHAGSGCRHDRDAPGAGCTGSGSARGIGPPSRRTEDRGRRTGFGHVRPGPNANGGVGAHPSSDVRHRSSAGPVSTADRGETAWGHIRSGRRRLALAGRRHGRDPESAGQARPARSDGLRRPLRCDPVLKEPGLHSSRAGRGTGHMATRRCWACPRRRRRRGDSISSWSAAAWRGLARPSPLPAWDSKWR